MPRQIHHLGVGWRVDRGIAAGANGAPAQHKVLIFTEPDGSEEHCFPLPQEVSRDISRALSPVEIAAVMPPPQNGDRS